MCWPPCTNPWLQANAEWPAEKECRGPARFRRKTRNPSLMLMLVLRRFIWSVHVRVAGQPHIRAKLDLSSFLGLNGVRLYVVDSLSFLRYVCVPAWCCLAEIAYAPYEVSDFNRKLFSTQKWLLPSITTWAITLKDVAFVSSQPSALGGLVYQQNWPSCLG